MKNKNFKTPIYITNKIVDEIKKIEKNDKVNILMGKTILDVFADEFNDGSYEKSILDKYSENTDTTIISCNRFIGNSNEITFLKLNTDEFDTFIGTPPLETNLTNKFVEKALRDIKEGGFVVFLIRQNWMCRKSRKELFENNKPSYILHLNERVPFNEDGKCSYLNYSVYIWKKGENPEYIKTNIIY